MENFKNFLTEAQKSDYVDGGDIMIFHYAPVDTEAVTVDPKYFADRAKRSSFTMREYETSTVPRTFWYVDPKQRERQVAQGRMLYQATIPAGAPATSAQSVPPLVESNKTGPPAATISPFEPST